MTDTLQILGLKLRCKNLNRDRIVHKRDSCFPLLGLCILVSSLCLLPRQLAAEATSLLAMTTPALPGAAQDERSYIIGPTNLLYIKVLGEEGMQQTFRIDEGGYITHPLLGRVKLAGKTISEAEDMLKNLLAGDYILNPNITIFVLEHSRFSVLGEVRRPGNYEILGRLSLIEAISIAGGLTPVGNDKKVKILRHDETGEKTILANVRDIMNGKKDIDIQAGDVIEIPKSFF